MSSGGLNSSKTLSARGIPSASVWFTGGAVAVGLAILAVGVLAGRDELVRFSGFWLGASGIAVTFIMARILKEVSLVRDGIERISRDELAAPIPVSHNAKPGQLADSVNTLADILKARRKTSEQRELVAVDTLSHIIEGRSYETFHHSLRIGEMSRELATLAGLSSDEAELLRHAAPMHDVGKVGLPDAVLNKPGKYSARESAIMKKHTELGYRILNRSERPVLKAAAVIAHQHHERWDGYGYPNRLQGEEIHIYARIVGLVDVFDAMFSKRIYRDAMPVKKALGIIKSQHGHHFDPHLLDLFLANVPRFEAIIDRYPDEELTVLLDPESESEPQFLEQCGTLQ